MVSSNSCDRKHNVSGWAVFIYSFLVNTISVQHLEESVHLDLRIKWFHFSGRLLKSPWPCIITKIMNPVSQELFKGIPSKLPQCPPGLIIKYQGHCDLLKWIEMNAYIYDDISHKCQACMYLIYFSTFHIWSVTELVTLILEAHLETVLIV